MPGSPPARKLQSFAGRKMDPLEMARLGHPVFGRVAGYFHSQEGDARWARDNQRPGDLRLEHLSPTIGSVVHGVDLSRPLPPATVAAIRHALLLRKVLFFHDQELTTEQHLGFARLFGELEVHPFTAGKEGHPEVLLVEHGEGSPGTENIYHSDVSWRRDPSLGSVLYCRECPEIGGDTVFVDMYAALQGLSDDVRDRIKGRTATHDWHFFRTQLLMNKLWTREQVRAAEKEYPPQRHPVVRTHPETGRDLLYVNAAFVKHVDGLPPDESTELLAALYKQAAAPEFQVRFRWRRGSVAFWDNRAVQHYAVSDYWPRRRMMERVTIRGDAPFHAGAPPAARM